MSQKAWDSGDIFGPEKSPEAKIAQYALAAFEYRQKCGLDVETDGHLYGGTAAVGVDDLKAINPTLGLLARKAGLLQLAVVLVADPPASSSNQRRWRRVEPNPPLRLAIKGAYHMPLVFVFPDTGEILVAEDGDAVEASKAHVELIEKWFKNIDFTNEAEAEARLAHGSIWRRRAKVAVAVAGLSVAGILLASNPDDELQPGIIPQNQEQASQPVEITAPLSVRGDTVLETGRSSGVDIELNNVLGVDCDSSYIPDPAGHDPFLNRVRLPRELVEPANLIISQEPEPGVFFIVDESRPPDRDGTWSRGGLALKYRPRIGDYVLLNWKARLTEDQDLYDLVPIVSRVEAVGDQIATLSVTELMRGTKITKGQMTVIINFEPMGHNGRPISISASCSNKR